VAGHRELSPLTTYLKSLTEYFGKRKIRTIQHSDIETLKLHLEPTNNARRLPFTGSWNSCTLC
jgi:hypothetical protein